MTMKGNLWRYLMEDPGEFILTGENSTGYEASKDPGAFDARVFWGVNAFIFTMVAVMCIWCWFFGGKDYLNDFANRQAESDRRWQERVRDRHERRMAARRSTPAKRTARLKRSFLRHKVQMTVKDGDIVEGDDANQRYQDQEKLKEERREELKRAETNEESDSTQDSSSTPPSVESNNNTDSSAEAMEEGTLPPTESEPMQPANETAVSFTPKEETNTSYVTTMEEGADAVAPPMMAMPSADDMFAEQPTGYLVLRPGDTAKPPQNPRMVPNCCAVCLGDYENGDKVVWSCNPECSHAFHLDCIMEWLLKIQDGGTPCPCCRQEFTSWEKDRQERKIKWAAGPTFDTNAVSIL